VTGDRTIQQGDNNNTIRANGDLTLTGDATVSTGVTVNVTNVGTGTITFEATNTLNGPGSAPYTLTGEYDAATFYHLGNGNWEVIGSIN
jgi:hypothetical protein